MFLLSGCARSLVYFPSNPPEEALRAQATAAGLEAWLDEDGQRIGWVARGEAREAATERTAVLVFHGNAGHAAMRSYYAQGFQGASEDFATPVDVHILEYPGYGQRPGKAAEKTIKPAALAAARELLAAYPRLFLIGESLGSGVAAYVAGDLPNRIDGLLLVTPFTSLKATARHHAPGLLVGLLLHERYDNVEALKRYHGPVAVLLAADDEVVPIELGRELYERYQGPKRLWVLPGRHSGLDLRPQAGWWEEVVSFLRQGGQPQSEPPHRPEPGAGS